MRKIYFHFAILALMIFSSCSTSEKNDKALFVKKAKSALIRPVKDSSELFELILDQIEPYLYFSSSRELKSGRIPTQEFLEIWNLQKGKSKIEAFLYSEDRVEPLLLLVHKILIDSSSLQLRILVTIPRQDLFFTQSLANPIFFINLNNHLKEAEELSYRSEMIGKR